MATYKSVEELPIWQEARKLSKQVHELIKQYQALERDFDLSRQLRKSAGSIMDNAAEGFEREGNAEFVYFLSISKGSCGEIQSQLYRAIDNAYIPEASGTELITACKQLGVQVKNLVIYLNTSGMKGNKFIKKK